MKEDKFYKLIELEYLLEELEDNIEYGNTYKPSSNIISRDIKKLINIDKEEAEVIRLVKGYIRDVTSLGIDVLKEVKKDFAQPIGNIEVSEPKEGSKNLKKVYKSSQDITKQFTFSQYQKWLKSYSDKLPKITKEFQDKLIVPVSVSYGKGFERAMEDIGLKPNTSWMYMPGHAVQRLQNINLVRHISSDISWEMQTAVVDGMRAGEGTAKIAKRIRAVNSKPKRINVPKIVDPKTGKTVRKEFSYMMSNRRYSEIVARTETMRATNEGRLDGYERSEVVKSVEWLTAGDKRVCDICEPHDREVFTLEESRGILPAHAQCRCTWAVHEYGEKVDKEKIQARYEVDNTDKVVNIAPGSMVMQGKEQTLKDMKRYENHLIKSKFHTEAKRKAILSRYKERLKKDLGMSVLARPEPTIENLYMFHNLKNMRHLFKRNVKKFPIDTVFAGQQVAPGMPKALGFTDLSSNWYGKLSEIPIITITNKGIYKHLNYTFVHEMGHSLQPTLTKKQWAEWEKLYNKTRKLGVRKFISPRASMGPEEDIAETIAGQIFNPKLVQEVTPEKSEFIRKYMLKGI